MTKLEVRWKIVCLSAQLSKAKQLRKGAPAIIHARFSSGKDSKALATELARVLA